MKRKHTAWQWHPPAAAPRTFAPFDGAPNVESATECTGLLTNVPFDDFAAESISDLYDIHEQQPIHHS